MLRRIFVKYVAENTKKDENRNKVVVKTFMPLTPGGERGLVAEQARHAAEHPHRLHRARRRPGPGAVFYKRSYANSYEYS